MKFGLFGAATAQRSNNPDVDSAAGFKDYIDYVIEAEALDGRLKFSKLLHEKALVVELTIGPESAAFLAGQMAKE